MHPSLYFLHCPLVIVGFRCVWTEVVERRSKSRGDVEACSGSGVVGPGKAVDRVGRSSGLTLSKSAEFIHLPPSQFCVLDVAEDCSQCVWNSSTTCMAVNSCHCRSLLISLTTAITLLPSILFCSEFSLNLDD